MFSESAEWYDDVYDAKDYAGEARLVADLVRRRRPGARTLLDAVTCLFSSVGYLGTVQRLRAAVRTMAGHLEPGGVLVGVAPG